MTEKKSFDVDCPSCGCQGKFITYNKIDICENPELRDKIFNREIFMFNCGECNEKFMIAYNTVYIDRENKYALALITDGSSGFSGDGITIGEYDLRIVRTVNSFIEKITLFEDGIDDRVAELLKLWLYENFETQTKSKAVAIFYGGRIPETDQLKFFFIGEENSSMETEISMESYRNILGHFQGSEFDKKDECEIDNDWALLALRDGVFNYVSEDDEK